MIKTNEIFVIEVEPNNSKHDRQRTVLMTVLTALLKTRHDGKINHTFSFEVFHHNWLKTDKSKCGIP
jgi:hypothetical protein